MAYGIQYQVFYNNEQNHEVLILLAKKDTEAAATPGTFEVLEHTMTDDTEDDVIITREVELIIDATDDTTVDRDTFMVGTSDEWWMIIYVESHAVFEGFVIPEFGHTPMLDKPYPVRIKATNSLKLLKNVALTRHDGTAFSGINPLIEYISACLSKTLLNGISDDIGIPLRIYSSLYNPLMLSRDEDITSDMYQHTYLDYRAFKDDALKFTNCYDVLKSILQEHSILFYWNGRWVIKQTSEFQYAPGGIYYTEYDNEGNVLSGVRDDEGVATVGSIALNYPINEDAEISAKFAIKTSKLVYEYKVFSELPNNNRFEYGDLVAQGPMADIYDYNNNDNFTEIIGTYKTFKIRDWTYGINTGPTSNNNLPVMYPTSDIPLRRSIYDIYGREITRELMLPSSSPGERWLQSSPIPVKAGARFTLSFNFRTEVDTGGASTLNLARVYIWNPVHQKYSMAMQDDWQIAKWFKTDGGMAQKAVVSNWTGGDDMSKYRSYNIDSGVIPIDGIMYIVLENSTFGYGGTTWYFSGFNFEYHPYIAGGYIPVKGDYYSHTQNANIDASERQTFLSDSTERIMKGAMLLASGEATKPNWRRHGLNESAHFKELLNLDYFNRNYRRFRKVEGSFTSTEFEPITDQLNKQPLSYHKNYLFLDFDTPREFRLIPPLTQDLGTGNITAVFEEVKASDNTVNLPVTRDRVLQGIIAAINNTTNSQWDEFAQAPGVGTPGFKPIAALFPTFAGSYFVQTDLDAVVTASASANGAGNSPYMVVNGSAVTTGSTLAWLLSIGPDVAVGNRFTITIYGHSVTYELTAGVIAVDGTTVPDSKEFNYIFE